MPIQIRPGYVAPPSTLDARALTLVRDVRGGLSTARVAAIMEIDLETARAVLSALAEAGQIRRARRVWTVAQ